MPAIRSRCSASARPNHLRSSSPKPRARDSATSASARRTWAGVRAATTVPPLVNRQSIPSAAAARPTSSTVPCMARCMALAASTPWSRAMSEPGAENSAEHQPPFLPEAPKPADLPFQQGDSRARRRPEQVVRSPEPGEPRPHHSHIDVDVPLQRTPRRDLPREPVPPKRQRPQAHLIRSVHVRFMILEPCPGAATKRDL